MARFIPIQRDNDYLFPPSMSDWLPEHHLSRSALSYGHITRGWNYLGWQESLILLTRLVEAELPAQATLRRIYVGE